MIRVGLFGGGLSRVGERAVTAKTEYHILPLVEPQGLIAKCHCIIRSFGENQWQARVCPVFRKIKSICPVIYWAVSIPPLQVLFLSHLPG